MRSTYTLSTCYHCGYRPLLGRGGRETLCDPCREAGHTVGPCVRCERDYLEAVATVVGLPQERGRE